MSEEKSISEEEKDVKILEIIQALSELGENQVANQLFSKISKKLEFVLLPDWREHQICGTFPKCDLRTMIYCCAPTNPCPYRAAILKKMGLTLADYTEVKKWLGAILVERLEGRKNGEDKSD